MKKRNIFSFIGIVIITGLMIHQVIVREHWSLKVSALFIAVFGLAVIINMIKIMYNEKKDC